MYPFGHLERASIHAYVVFTNQDSHYLYWCDDAAHRLGGPDGFVLVLQGRLPTTPDGLGLFNNNGQSIRQPASQRRPAQARRLSKPAEGGWRPIIYFERRADY